MKPGSGRTPRLSELERSAILALVKLTPPDKPTSERTGERATPDPRGGVGVDSGRAHRHGPGAWHSRRAQPGAAHLPSRGRALASDPAVGDE
jgi:hypothetical protein